MRWCNLLMRLVCLSFLVFIESLSERVYFQSYCLQTSKTLRLEAYIAGSFQFSLITFAQSRTYSHSVISIKQALANLPWSNFDLVRLVVHLLSCKMFYIGSHDRFESSEFTWSYTFLPFPTGVIDVVIPDSSEEMASLFSRCSSKASSPMSL